MHAEYTRVVSFVVVAVVAVVGLVIPTAWSMGHRLIANPTDPNLRTVESASVDVPNPLGVLVTSGILHEEVL